MAEKKLTPVKIIGSGNQIITFFLGEPYQHLLLPLIGNLQTKRQILRFFELLMTESKIWTAETIANLREWVLAEEQREGLPDNANEKRLANTTSSDTTWAVIHDGKKYRLSNKKITLRQFINMKNGSEPMPLSFVRLSRMQSSPEDLDVKEVEIVYF